MTNSLADTVCVIHGKRNGGPHCTIHAAQSWDASWTPRGAKEGPSGTWQVAKPLSDLKSFLQRLQDAQRNVLVLAAAKATRWAESVSKWLTTKGAVEEVVEPFWKAFRTRVDLLGNGSPPWLGFPPSPLEVFNDINSLAFGLFHALRTGVERQRLFALSRLRPVAAQDVWLATWTPVEAHRKPLSATIWAFYLEARRQLVAGLRRRTGLLQPRHPEEAFDRRQAAAFYQQLDLIDSRLGDVHGRLLTMQIDHSPIEKVTSFYDGSNTVFWARPSRDRAAAVLQQLGGLQGAAVVYVEELQKHRGWKSTKLPVGAILHRS